MDTHTSTGVEHAQEILTSAKKHLWCATENMYSSLVAFGTNNYQK